MKKQILFLTFFVAAILAGMNSYGQYQTVLTTQPADAIITPTTLSGCSTVDALHPIQGEVYTYTVANTPANATIRWFVVDNEDLKSPTTGGQTDSIINTQNAILPITSSYIDATDAAGAYEITTANPSSYIYSVGTPADYNSLTSTSVSIDIAWKYFNGNQPNEILLIAYVQSDPTCTDNIAVYRIIPMPAFTIDIAVLDEDGDSINAPGTGTVSEECVSPIEFATYNSGSDVTPGGTLTVDYGENWVYYVVNGANYIDSWMPNFQISYDDGATLTAEWAYATDAANAATANWNTISNFSDATPETIPVIAGGSAASPGTVGAGIVPAAGGESIVVRVRLDYGTGYEHDDTNGILSFAVDGIAYDGVGTTTAEYYSDGTNFGDLHYGTCAIDGFTNDVVQYYITPRPEVEAGTPAMETKTGDEVD
ncbi:hypothetical protein [uncultured Draconibacterium sp.]|uniref:hypothetical protein n=1 Tax=uncultured Draconibacterium sp. TaxID=1573823 RepID=UPI00321763BF